MSELQIALLVIGLGAVLVVYLYGNWQQMRYRRRFGSMFKPNHSDVLTQQASPDPALDDPDPFSTLADHETPADSPSEPVAGSVDLRAANLLDDSCSLLDTGTDFIIELHLAEAGTAAALDGLWQRKFDFRKPVQVCGLKLGTSTWERAIADSPVRYKSFRIALQLVDRGGAITEVKLSDFRDLILGIAGKIKADISVPDIREAYQRAVELDTFCAGVDQMAGVNLVTPGGRLLQGAKISQAATLVGMTLEADGAFHLLNSHGQSLFSLINQDGQPFQHLSLDTSTASGITLLLDIPRVDQPGNQFDHMMRVARELAKELQVKVVDDNRVELNDSGLALIHAKITNVVEKMVSYGIEPGSLQALRLFS
jgi:FtsZ-interacting cell division protein ZipA